MYECNTVSSVEAVESLPKIKQSASNLGINEAALIHIDCLLYALHFGNAKKARWDTTLHSFFTKK